MHDILKISVLLLAAYILGSIPFGLIVGKLAKGVDIREHGSGNIGATNVLRILGPRWASVVFILDILKGFVPTFIAGNLGLTSDWFVVLAGAIAAFGHTFSVFIRFKGGKGVATSLGVIIGLNPIIAGLGLLIFLIVTFIWRYVSLGSCIGTLSVFLMMLFWKSMDTPLSYKVVVGILIIAIIAKHIPNLKRIINGTEAKIGQKIDI